ncbi:MAG: hypothetical protein JOY76_07795 [Hyphomicrobiales bacterium]|nr:hypothetical protein [Hyphomicrobiales bacterium]MBV8427934.1 hypothetical protein [Hyphomicrobiales bacterium]
MVRIDPFRLTWAKLAAGTASTVALVATFACATVARALAEEPDGQPVASTNPYHELETKYLFGFTTGSDIGEEGEKSIEFETTAALGKRRGSYHMVEQEFELEGVPSQFFAYELSAHVTNHSSNSVEGIDDIDRTQFSGFSTTLSYLIVGRGPGSPIGLTFSAQPEWARADGTSGVRTRDFSTAFKLIADTELISNRLYAAVNLLFQPEIAKPSGDLSWSRTATAGVTAALTYRIAPKVTMGGEVEYYRAYEGFDFRSLDGHALYIGPTLYIQFTPKTFLSLAFSSQVTGHATGDGRSLDLVNFERHRANAKLEFEF